MRSHLLGTQSRATTPSYRNQQSEVVQASPGHLLGEVLQACPTGRRAEDTGTGGSYWASLLMGWMDGIYRFMLITLNSSD